MKRLFPWVMWTLCASAALAEPPAASGSEAASSQLVEQQLLTPLKRAESKRRRFSRAAPVVLERRVRVLDDTEQVDARGRKFRRFTVDERRPYDQPEQWHSGHLAGCVYAGERQVFVQRGESYVAARSVLGEESSPRKDVCRATTASHAASDQASTAAALHAAKTAP